MQGFSFELPIVNKFWIKYKNKVVIQKHQQIYSLKMSQNCIEYEDYKKILQQNTLSPRRNIFEQNRVLAQQLDKLTSDNKELNNKIAHYRNICTSIIDAIGRVFSQQLARQLEQIMVVCEEGEQVSMMTQTIYQALATHQSQLTVSDYSQSRHSEVRTPEKLGRHSNRELLSYREQSFRNSNQLSPSLSSKRRSVSRSPFSSVSALQSSIKYDPSTNRSNNAPPSIIATGINCQLCQQTFAPNQFIQHASRCKQNSEQSPNMSLHTEQQSSSSCSSEALRQITLQDTQDRKLRKQGEDYMKMMKNLIMMQNQIQQQIQMLRFSKDKIDREAEKRKLEKDLAKVMYVIEQKKKQGKEKDKQKNKSKCQPYDKSLKLAKKNSTKLKN